MYTLYWIHLPEHIDIKTQGYVGITNNVEERFRRHKSTATHPTNSRCIHLENAINKYDNLVYEVIATNLDKELAEFIEQELRPEREIGWNIAIGGGLPPCMLGEDNPFYGKTHTQESKQKMKDTLATHDRTGTMNSNADLTVYTFKHEGHGLRECTRYEFEQEFGFTLKPLFRTTNPTKTRKGWKIINGK